MEDMQPAQYGALLIDLLIQQILLLILETLKKLHTIINVVHLIELEILPGERQAVTVALPVQPYVLI